MPAQYDSWFAGQLKGLINAITNQTEVGVIQKEIERGIQHAKENPGAISQRLLIIGQSALKAIGAPLQEGQSPVQAATLDMTELSEAVVSRKKGRVTKKLRGSLDDLKSV